MAHPPKEYTRKKGLRIDFLWSEGVQNTYERTTVRCVDNCGRQKKVQELRGEKGGGGREVFLTMGVFAAVDHYHGVQKQGNNSGVR
jgi:hypothetical protein